MYLEQDIFIQLAKIWEESGGKIQENHGFESLVAVGLEVGV